MGGIKLFSFTYASSATKRFTSAELLELLTKSLGKNQANGITGMLLYRDGNFLQVLEGEETTVRETMGRILADPRHRGVLRLMDGPISVRQFPDWSMAFRDLDSPEAAATPGFNQFMNQRLMPTELAADRTAVQKLLEVFRASMR